MVAKAKSKKVTKTAIISMYMEYVLEHEVMPKSVYKFCKRNAIGEAVFYENFGSLAGLQSEIWTAFYENTESLIEKNKAYDSFSNKEKMLTFFYSFFELLTLNRSYVLFALQSEGALLKSMKQLSGLRKKIRGFAAELIEDGNSEKKLRITRHNPKVFSEGAWLQFLFLLNFWMEDNSAGFEKTDLAIEKSIHTIFDVFDNMPLNNIIDFGKFLFKEKFV